MIFDAASLHTAVQAALTGADIPADAAHAFALIATLDGVKGVYSTRLHRDAWQVDTFFSIPRHAPITAGVAIKAVW